MLTVVFGSHNRIKATLTDENGDAVEGATLILTVTDRSKATVIDEQAMTEDGDGLYSYLATPEQLSRREHRYRATVHATSPANIERLTEVTLFTAIDAD